jgi:signal peptidase II
MNASPWLSFWKYPWRLALVVFVVDQFVKELIMRFLNGQGDLPVIGSFFSLVCTRNSGGAWSILNQHTWLLTLISCGFAIMVAWKFRQMHEGHVGKALALALLAGGVWGNLFDRLFRIDRTGTFGCGEVVDYLRFLLPIGERGYQYPDFNVADMAICCGVFVYLWLSFRHTPAPAANPEPPSNA